MATSIFEQPIHLQHPCWPEFIRRLAGPEGCQCEEDDAGQVTYRCQCGSNKDYAREILEEMGFTPQAIYMSCLYFDEQGSWCNCEILFKIAAPVQASSP